MVLVIHWRGGQHSEVRARKPKPGEHRKRTSDAAGAIILEMAGTWSDAQMATALNRMGIRTGQGQTMRDAATYAGISHHFVRRLVDRGVLPANRWARMRPARFAVCTLIAMRYGERSLVVI